MASSKRKIMQTASRQAPNKAIRARGEKPAETAALNEDIPEGYRDIPLDERKAHADGKKQKASSSEHRTATENRPSPSEQEHHLAIPDELIRERAYHLSEQRGGLSPDPESDWFEAEQQLQKEIRPEQK